MKKTIVLLLTVAACMAVFQGCRPEKDGFTRGVGVYPGKLSEDFSPVLVPDNENYRNIALLRPAYHSSSYDYNLTAQLITDGILSQTMPATISLSTHLGEMPKNEREWLLDDNSITDMTLQGNDIFIQYAYSNDNAPSVDKIGINGSMQYDDKKPAGWKITCQASNNGSQWTTLKELQGSGLPGMERPNPYARMMAAMNQKGKDGAKPRPVNPFLTGPYGNDSTAPKPSFSFNFGIPRPQRIIQQAFEFPAPLSYKYYRIALSTPCAESWRFGDLDFFLAGNKLKMVPSHAFNSAWMSAGNAEEWVYVDLGTESTFDTVKLHWLNKAVSGSVQVSNDAGNWKTLADLPGGAELTDRIALEKQAKGRYLRVLMNKAASDKGYVLSELEVMGKGGLAPNPKPSPAIAGNKMPLIGGAWKIQRVTGVNDAGEAISTPGFTCDNWVTATVPGTVLTSYWNAGALPDPNFGDNQLMISESFFNADFWYRNEFMVPAEFSGDRMLLNFDGINWKADVFVNGTGVGKIEGAFIRGVFDVTNLVKKGEKNAIAVLIHKNDNIGIVKEQTALSPDKNGGVLGADNPTYHASIGWDWIPTIRGRNIGIWNDVFLQTTGEVTLEAPFVYADLNLPDTSVADIHVEVMVKNHGSADQSGVITGSYGDMAFEQSVELKAGESKVVKLNAATHPALLMKNPKLWWPKGYGAPYLYPVRLSFKTADGRVSDSHKFMSGIREMTFTEDNGILNMYINGRRFIGRGGNWGFPESNLNYRGREYDIAVAYHADMNFTMIRNWVGQTGDDEFYEACDRHGIMVWQDFWLANPADGPNPNDPEMFMHNAGDMVKRIRNHPSIGLYCGRNEGNPPQALDTALRSLIAHQHPDLHYISHSSEGVVSGGGPYRALPPRDYYLLYGFNKFHSERGMPNVMTYESMVQTLPEHALWPQNSQWGIHDYCLEGAQAAASFNEIIEKAFGPSKDAKEFTELAQWINYDGYRAIFEGRSMHRQGMLLWMSHPAWPSMVWQTYDYYFDPTAAYFGCKKASEPIHIQWNPVFHDIEVVNYHAGDRSNLTAKSLLVNMDGTVVWEKETKLDCGEDSTVTCFRLEFPENLSDVYFIKLILTEGGKVISDNFYWKGREDGNFRALRQMPAADVKQNTTAERTADGWKLTTTLKNVSDHPALMIRLKVVGKTTGKRMLPVFFSDNFVSLMPGEEKQITATLKYEDTRGEKPVVELSGFNL